jgi:DNA-binding IclR family transcriptional regulator
MHSGDPEGAVDKALRLLSAFTLTSPELGIAELSKAVCLPKSTTHRLVTSLCNAGYLEQDPITRKYSVGLRAFAVGALAVCHRGLGLPIQPDLAALSEACHETVNVGVLVGNDVMYANKIKTREETLEGDLEVGQMIPAWCTALGKVLLAHLSDDRLASIVASLIPLRKYTANTNTDIERLKRHLQDIRADRFATDDQEFRTGLCCVAVPILDKRERAVAAVSIAASASRTSVDELWSYRALLWETSRRISARLIILGKA